MPEKKNAINQFKKALLPITLHSDPRSALTAAHALVGEGEIVLVGLYAVPPGKSLSTGATEARKIRTLLQRCSDNLKVTYRKRVRVSFEPWEDFLDLVDEEQPDLVVLEWPAHFEDMGISPEDALVRPTSNFAVIRGPIPDSLQRLLVALHDNPYAEFALRTALTMTDNSSAKLTALHLKSAAPDQASEEFASLLASVLNQLEHVNQIENAALDHTREILKEAAGHDLVILSARDQPRMHGSAVSPLARHILRECPGGVVTMTAMRSPDSGIDMPAGNAISVLVDRWFAENTYHADEFNDLERLLELKASQGVTVSLALPALNEEETVGNVIQTIKSALMDEVPLLDEIVLLDSNSTDRTREIAAACGVPVYVHQQVLPEYGARSGKGEALWKSLHVTRGDILLWVDTDIVNIHPRFVYGLLGPLLLNPALQFIKGFYRRPIKMGERLQAGGGGRVTELTARPLLNLFYPELSGVVQPLSGEYGGRRSALERLTFFSGYGVETGLLIDVFEKFGLRAIAQVDLRERIHHNQPLESLSKMSFAIIQAVIHKLEQRYGLGMLDDINKSMKLIRYEPERLFLEVEEIAERDRPPIIEIAEYRKLHNT